MPELENKNPNCREIAQKLAQFAEKMDCFVAKNCLTQIHGDCKGWNIFLGRSNEEEVLLIDMQWTGRGHPLQVISINFLPLIMYQY